MTTSTIQTAPRRRTIPPLETGDRLTAAEFERRWEAMPYLKNTELINGVVYMAAALRHEQHGRPHMQLGAWLGHYMSLTPGLDASDNASLRLDEDNVPQPDLLLRIPESAGGRSRVTKDGYLQGPPERVAEVAASSSSLDLNDKLHVYRRHGVQEYVTWRVLDERVDWFVLREGRYEPKAADEKGILKSGIFPGLWLDVPALLRGDLKHVSETVERGVASEPRDDFLKRLRGAEKK